MRNLTLTFLFVAISYIGGFAQVGIGTTTPNSSSILDLTSTGKAFLPPRMTTAQRNAIATPIAGMTIFNTDSTCIEICRGTTWYNMCTGKSYTIPTLPPVDGFTSSNQIALANLIAYFPFDGSTNESIHTAAPILTGGTSSFVTGRIGQAVKLTNGWLTYPAAATGASVGTNAYGNNDTLAGGFTLSMWVQIPDSSLLTNLFQLSHPNIANWPLLGLAYRKHDADSTVDMNGGLTNLDGTGTHPTYGGAFLTSLFKDSSTVGGSKWAFLAMVYDTTGAAHHLSYYANGIIRSRISLDSLGTATPADVAFPVATENLQMLCAYDNPLGNFATIGTFESKTTTPGDASNTIPSYMSAGITAVFDDIRFFNTTLSARYIGDLYTLGNQGR